MGRNGPGAHCAEPNDCSIGWGGQEQRVPKNKPCESPRDRTRGLAARVCRFTVAFRPNGWRLYFHDESQIAMALASGRQGGRCPIQTNAAAPQCGQRQREVDSEPAGAASGAGGVGASLTPRAWRTEAIRSCRPRLLNNP